MATFNLLKIKNIKREISKAVSINFDVPVALKNTYLFQAGQYITLKTQIDGQEVRRDYSISASPQSEELTVTIKEIAKGLFSSYANQHLKKGDVLEVSPPKGRFIFKPIPNDKSTIVAFAAGSGITPIMSILKTVLETNTEQKFILIYGNKTPEETIFYNTLSLLEAKYPNRFQLQYVYSKAQSDGSLFGRIDKGNINYALKNLIDLDETSAFYLCGPEEMIHATKAVLLDHKVPEEAILFELFTASAPTNEAIIRTTNSDIEVTLLVDDQTEVFLMSPEHTILEAALKQELDVPYSCQGGVCSSCICRLTKGSAEMRQNSVLTDSEIAEGLVLSCQAVPTSSQLHVDFDDV